MTASNPLASALPSLTNVQNTADLSRPGNNSGIASPEANARAKANEFEASFIAALLQPVFEGLARNNTFGGGFAEETWTGLLTEEYAKGIAGSANLGIADQVYNQLIKLQQTQVQSGGAAAGTRNQE